MQRVSSVPRTRGRNEVIGRAQRHHVWFFSVPGRWTRPVRPPHAHGLPAACREVWHPSRSSGVLSGNCNSCCTWAPQTEMRRAVSLHFPQLLRVHLLPHTGRRFHKKGYLAILNSTVGSSEAAHFMLNAIRGLSSRFCQGLFLSSPWSSSSSSSSSSS